MRIPRLAAISATLLLVISMASGQQAPSAPKAPARPGLTLTTTAFQDGGIVPEKYTQSVPNFVSPPLEWTNVPPNTQTFALIVHDLDVARQKSTTDVLHWMIFNIPGSAHSLMEGVPDSPQLPDGAVQGKNVRGKAGYLGPGAPSVGPNHHYAFELYALDSKVDLGPDASRDDLLKAMDGHILGKGVLVGRHHLP
jgi:Raf kinase inhibitor-like YbhB/YbcL family protein